MRLWTCGRHHPFSFLTSEPGLSYSHHPPGSFNLPSNLFQGWQMWHSHQCHSATEQSIQSYSADPAAWLPLPKEGPGRNIRSAEGGWMPSPTWIPPQGHVIRRDLQAFREGREVFLSLCFVSLVFCATMQSCWPMVWGCSPSAPSGAQGWGTKPGDEQMSPPHDLLLKPCCSSDPKKAELLMFTGKAILKCDVCVHAGTLKPCSPLLWMPLDHKALHIRLYFNSYLTLPMHLKHSKKKEFKALILRFFMEKLPKTC